MSTDRVRLSHLYEDLTSRIASLTGDSGGVRASRSIVEAALGDGKAYYGTNTGLGILADKRIEPDQLRQLQKNLILSHAVGVGEPVPMDISRLILGIKIHSLGLGFSGISLNTFKKLIELWDRQLTPVIPSRGSVGASGDLAPWHT